MTYGLIGETLGHSHSPRIHAALGNPDYALHSLPPEALDAFLRARDFRGLNVTIPYKKAVIPYCDRLSPSAEQIGSVNTLVVGADGRMTGYNTDFDGFLYAVRAAGIDFSGKKVLVLGTGGTSLTALAAARALGAAAVGNVSRRGPLNYDTVYAQTDAEIIVNTTPVGMYPRNGAALLDLARFPKLCGVVDVIYNPLLTPLLLAAQARGIPCTNGLPMLVQQAKVAEELFFDRVIDDAETRRVTCALTAQVTNLVLIGMPGSGKTEIGRRLAARLGRPFVDADERIAALAGLPIPQIFRQAGEARFRALECRVLAELGKQGGQVIATGGGAVLRPENYAALKQNGRLYQLSRDRALLAVEGRPLSASAAALEAMEQARAPLYERFRDVLIVNNGTEDDAVRRIEEDFDEAAGH